MVVPCHPGHPAIQYLISSKQQNQATASSDMRGPVPQLCLTTGHTIFKKAAYGALTLNDGVLNPSVPPFPHL